MIRYGVVDDYGDNWEDGEVVFTSTSQVICEDWAEENNYHSASIVELQDINEAEPELGQIRRKVNETEEFTGLSDEAKSITLGE